MNRKKLFELVKSFIKDKILLKIMKTSPPCASPSVDTSPGIPEDLRPYANVIRDSIEKGDCDLFLNSSHRHAAVIMQLFCEAARSTIHIFCGHLNRVVYNELWPAIQAAVNRGVEVRIVTERVEADAESLAAHLRGGYIWRSLGRNPELPHFAIVDGKMSRLETGREQATAVVRTNVADDDSVGKNRMQLFEAAFAKLWDSAEPVA